jgi:hypothetical protein
MKYDKPTEIKLEWLVGYLPYELKFKVPKYYHFGGMKTDSEVMTMETVKKDWIHFEEGGSYHPIEDFQPILRPLKEIYDIPEIMDEFSDYHREHFEMSFFFFGHGCLSRFDTINAAQLQLMYKYHMDIFQLIDLGLAIDKNTL